jgi:hypothetical protein
MSDNENTYEDYSEIMSDLVERLNNFENPESVTLKCHINQSFRDEFYKNMTDMHPREILDVFGKCGNINTADYDFGKISEENVKKQILKMKKMKDNIEKKMEELKNNN